MESELDAAICQAWAAHDRQDWHAAIGHWQDCIRLYPGLATAPWMAGALMLDHGRLDEAEAMLATALRLDPDNLSLATNTPRRSRRSSAGTKRCRCGTRCWRAHPRTTRSSTGARRH